MEFKILALVFNFVLICWPKTKLKSFKRDNICKLCFWMPEQLNCLILTSWHVPKLRYRAQAKNENRSYIAQNHSSMSILKYLLH